MGGSTYNFKERSLRATTMNYMSAPIDQIFEQNTLKKIHDSLNPKGLKFRECRDSEAHPKALPIIIGLDDTGSMSRIPHMLIKDGLPEMMTKLHEKKLDDASVCFIVIGDHKYDRAPLQVGQFESGDSELDLHLTRSWLEGGGGGNGGESYLLAYYFAAKHTVTDAWEKRKEKGFLFTIGDEPCHPDLAITSVKEIFGDEEAVERTYTAKELVAMTREKWHLFHLNVHDCASCVPDWKELLGEGCIDVQDYREVPNVIAATIASFNRVSVVEAVKLPVEGDEQPEKEVWK